MADNAQCSPLVTSLDAMRGLSLIELAYAVDLVVLGKIKVENPGERSGNPGETGGKAAPCRKERLA